MTISFTSAPGGAGGGGEAPTVFSTISEDGVITTADISFGDMGGATLHPDSDVVYIQHDFDLSAVDISDPSNPVEQDTFTMSDAAGDGSMTVHPDGSVLYTGPGGRPVTLSSATSFGSEGPNGFNDDNTAMSGDDLFSTSFTNSINVWDISTREDPTFVETIEPSANDDDQLGSMAIDTDTNILWIKADFNPQHVAVDISQTSLPTGGVGMPPWEIGMKANEMYDYRTDDNRFINLDAVNNQAFVGTVDTE